MRTSSIALAVLLLAGCFDNRPIVRRDAGVPRDDAGPRQDAARDDAGGARCADGVREGDEDCDGLDLGGATCASLGLGDGVLACTGSCTFDGAGCTSCVPRCAGRECGDDGCGGTCGACEAPEACSGGVCLCAPSCGGRTCGDDGCGGSCGSCDGTCEAGVCLPAADGLRISEVFYNAVGADDQLEWVELYNAGSRTIDLSRFSLGAGGNDYTYSVYALSGTIPAGGCVVVGGPLRTSANGAPVLAQPIDFEPDLQNSGTIADGVALFALDALSITPASVPVDAVIYGSVNDSGLLDETGGLGAVDVEAAPEGGSIQRTATGWRTSAVPDPNRCAL